MASFFSRLSSRKQLAIPASLALLVAIAGASIAQAYQLIPGANVSRDDAESILPKVAQDPDGNAHVVWVSNNGGRRSVQYSRGTWNGSNYSFSSQQLVADVGGFQYATPAIFVAPDKTVMVVWSEGFALKARTFASSAAAPTGETYTLGPGFNASVSADYDNRFHIAWDGDFHVQYCEFVNGTCADRETLSLDEGSLHPDIAVDDENNVHLVWEGGLRTKYRTRLAGSGAPLSDTEIIGPGVKAQVAVDGQGGIHIVASNDYNTVYCKKTLNGPCENQRTFDFATDLEPSIGATRGGTVVVLFRDDANDVLAINSLENGAWSPSKEVAGSTTQVDVTSRPYTSRFSFVWSDAFDVQHASVAVSPLACDTVITGQPEPAQAPVVAPAQYDRSQVVLRFFPVMSRLTVGGPRGGPC